MWDSHGAADAGRVARASRRDRALGLQLRGCWLFHPGRQVHHAHRVLDVDALLTLSVERPFRCGPGSRISAVRPCIRWLRLSLKAPLNGELQ
jgi:hypothetical protein